jgi:hypothetical protein
MTVGDPEAAAHQKPFHRPVEPVGTFVATVFDSVRVRPASKVQEYRLYLTLPLRSITISKQYITLSLGVAVKLVAVRAVPSAVYALNAPLSMPNRTQRVTALSAAMTSAGPVVIVANAPKHFPTLVMSEIPSQ